VLWGLGGLGLVAIGAVAGWTTYVRSVETPPHRVVQRDGAFELRDYPALNVAEVVRDGPRDQAIRAGFRPLARYIFARERAGEKIAMTAPVTQEPAGPSAWRVRFVMPRGYGLADLPRPAGSDVRLVRTEPQRLAAVRFAGVVDDALLARQEERLRAWLAERGLEPGGAPIYAFYDDPFTPGFLRRNEVLIRVDDTAEAT